MIQNKSRLFQIFESVLFTAIMSILALRLTFAENPGIESFSLTGTYYDNFISICISSLLIILCTIWFAAKAANAKYRPGGLEYGILIFIAGAVISTLAASNRRAAVTDSVTIISAMLSGIVLSNILQTTERKKVLLFVLAAVAAASVYQCIEQYSTSNKFMIEQYQNDPLSQLRALGIEPGTFQQMLYEHRLYSKDVRGFFTTGNGEGSLLVTAIFAVLAAFDLRDLKFKKIWFPIVLVLVLLGGMILAHSKGAFGSLIIGGLLLLIAKRFGIALKTYRKAVITIIIILIILSAGIITGYGLHYGTLPGGNSMRVRWEYWYSTAKMIVDFPITGIGGGNFGTYFAQYKLPQTLESVRDPHCFILSILSQYGIIGLAGFLTAIFIPILKATGLNRSDSPTGNNIISAAKGTGICVVLALLFIRPIFIRTQIGNTIDVILYIIVVTYVAPAFFTGTALWLGSRTEEQNKKITPIYRPALLCGIFALLIHNLIDFGIFEPGIMTAFWALIAILQSDIISEEPAEKIKSIAAANKFKKFIFLMVPAAVIVFLVWLCIIPAAETASKMEEAKELYSNGEIDKAVTLLKECSNDDALNPSPAAFAGKAILTKYEIKPSESAEILMDAEKFLKTAIDRDKEDFRNYENLGKVYDILGQRLTEQRKEWFKKSFFSYEQALIRYPASSELNLELAEIAQQLDSTNLAIEHYKKAIEIEDAFAAEYKIMYPGQKASSRMGQSKYLEAKEKLEELTGKNK